MPYNANLANVTDLINRVPDNISIKPIFTYFCPSERRLMTPDVFLFILVSLRTLEIYVSLIVVEKN